MIIPNIRHPAYMGRQDEWNKWRLVYNGGTEFVNTYLKKFSNRETDDDFAIRKSITPTPNFAKAGVNDIRNSIFQRLADVNRRNGSTTYSEAVRGVKLGVDREGSSMNSFLGRKILNELMVMSKIGVFVDMPPVQGGTLRDSIGVQPYLYRYLAEDILSWRIRPDVPDEFDSLLLRDFIERTETTSMLPCETKERYRFIFREDGVVKIQLYEKYFIEAEGRHEQRRINKEGNLSDEEYVLEIDSIPFVLFELSDSLIADVANHQIALLNLESSDINYSLKSNFPFYTEQGDDRDFGHLNKGSVPEDDGTAATANTSKDEEVRVGSTVGRRYGMNMERPGFIHPSPEPLEASMKKQETLKADIRLLINLSLSNVKPKMASAESKSLDERGLEAGLSSIGLVLEHGERKIARFWHDLEKSKNDFSIKYPEKWSLKSDADKRQEAESWRELRDTIPSPTFQRTISKEIVTLVLGSIVGDVELEKIRNEIESADSYTADPETIFRGVELGMADPEFAAKLLGWPKETVEKAKIAHAERLARINEAQSAPGEDNNNPGARGITDLDPNPGQSGRQEKASSRDNTTDPTPGRKVRGDAEPETTL